ncbi:MAG: hypothetical protein SGJ02_02125 [bacterium]|nr:hypothetical protein [bacterium]
MQDERTESLELEKATEISFATYSELAAINPIVLKEILACGPSEKVNRCLTTLLTCSKDLAAKIRESDPKIFLEISVELWSLFIARPCGDGEVISKEIREVFADVLSDFEPRYFHSRLSYHHEELEREISERDGSLILHNLPIGKEIIKNGGCYDCKFAHAIWRLLQTDPDLEFKDFAKQILNRLDSTKKFGFEPVESIHADQNTQERIDKLQKYLYQYYYRTVAFTLEANASSYIIGQVFGKLLPQQPLFFASLRNSMERLGVYNSAEFAQILDVDSLDKKTAKEFKSSKNTRSPKKFAAWLNGSEAFEHVMSPALIYVARGGFEAAISNTAEEILKVLHIPVPDKIDVNTYSQSVYRNAEWLYYFPLSI